MLLSDNDITEFVFSRYKDNYTIISVKQHLLIHDNTGPVTTFLALLKYHDIIQYHEYVCSLQHFNIEECNVICIHLLEALDVKLWGILFLYYSFI